MVNIGGFDKTTGKEVVLSQRFEADWEAFPSARWGNCLPSASRPLRKLFWVVLLKVNFLVVFNRGATYTDGKSCLV